MKNILMLVVLLFSIVEAENSILKKQSKVKQYFTKEAERYTVECEQGKLEECNKLGNLYNTGMGVSQDMDKAIQFLGIACNGNISYACTNLGIKYRVDFFGVEKDNAKAVEYFLKAVKLYEKACDSRYGSMSCLKVVNICNIDNKIKESYIDLATSYVKSCANGDMKQCFKLGRWYDEGIGVERNTSKAMELYEKSCDGKVARGCNEAAKKYNSKDKAKSFSLFFKSSEMNDGEGFRNIGLKYANGSNNDINYTKAKYFLKKACDLKDIVGCTYYDTLSAQGY